MIVNIDSRNTLNDHGIDSLYDAGNDAGRGFAIGKETMTELEAAEAAGLKSIQTWDNSTALGSHAVGIDANGHVIAIADIYGPWAVDITEEFGREIVGNCTCCGATLPRRDAKWHNGTCYCEGCEEAAGEEEAEAE